MADMNICADLVIEEMNFEKPYYEMFLAQKRLQLRLNTNFDYDLNAPVAAKKCIYWYFCVMDELKELLDWVKPHINVAADPTVLKELRMEAIDVVHFVLNIGLELGFNEDTVNEMFINSPESPIIVLSHAELEKLATVLSNKIIELIEMLPWKSWKIYPDIQIKALPELVSEEFAKVITLCICLCNSTALSKQDIVNYYFAKNKENHRRQDDGYRQ